MSSATAVSNLIARYAELLDDGDFAGLGELFAEGHVRGQRRVRVTHVGDMSRHLCGRS
ncbi:MAG TPA: hypothetical protein VG756_27800 [Pseudonocardiaceae bacterium]|nr:hypothetical protein [Pseudonocardiaceae bacterium]